VSSLASLINVQIKVSSTAPAQANFGVPAIFAYHTHYPDRIRYYSALSGMISDGFLVTDPAYKAAAEILDQTPTVTTFAVARRTLAPVQTVTLTLSSASSLDTYAFVIVGSDGVVHTVTQASTGVPATDATTLATTLGAFSNIGTVTHAGAVVTITQASGKLNDYQSWGAIGAAGGPNIALANTTADPGIATDLAAVYAIDQGWYGIVLDSNSKAEILAAAAWAQANGYHVLAVDNSDTVDVSSATGNVFSSLLALAYTRTICEFNGSQMLSYEGAATLGVVLPLTPGSYTAAYKTLVGVPSDPPSVLTGTAVTNLTTNNGNYYTTYKGIPVLIPGITPSGEYLDTTIGIDWLQDAITTALYTLLVNNPKIAYTDGGIAQCVNVIRGVLNQGITNGLLASSPAPNVLAPLVSSISLSNVASRNVPSITFTATLAGAIQVLNPIQGSVVLP
jgi:hypothetical protein